MSVKIRNENGVFEVVSDEEYLVRKDSVVLWHWIADMSKAPLHRTRGLVRESCILGGAYA